VIVDKMIRLLGSHCCVYWNDLLMLEQLELLPEGRQSSAAGLLLARGLQAKPADKSVRIGVLIATPEPMPLDLGRLEIVRSALRELGWVEGKNLGIESRHAGINPQRHRELAAELRVLPVALFIANGTTSIRAARDGAPGLPIRQRTSSRLPPSGRLPRFQVALHHS
jgi:hypothetical protein